MKRKIIVRSRDGRRLKKVSISKKRIASRIKSLNATIDKLRKEEVKKPQMTRGKIRRLRNELLAREEGERLSASVLVNSIIETR